MIKQLIFFILVLLFVTSCKNDVKDLSEKSEHSSFVASQLILNKSKFIQSSQNFNLPQSNKLTIKTCLIQTETQENIINETFSIQIQDSIYIKSTDIKGCLTFDHYESFNYAKKEHFIKKQIKIKGISNYKGIQEFNIAINPWSNKSDALKDLRSEYDSLDQSDEDSSALSTKNNSNLGLNNVSFNLLTKNNLSNNDLIFSYNLSASPYLLRENLNNDLVESKLYKGKLNISLKLVENSSADNRKLISEKRINVSINSFGKISSKITFNIDKTKIPSEFSKTELVLTILPENSNLIKPLIGIYNMSGLNNLESGDMLLIENQEQLSNMLANENEEFSLDQKIETDSPIGIGTLNIYDKSIDPKGFELSDNLELNLTRKYKVEFNPKIKIINPTTLKDEYISLNDGKYKIISYIANPKDLNNEEGLLDINNLNILSKNETITKLHGDKSISTIIKFKLNMNASKRLAFENILLIKIESIDGNYSSPFFARSINLYNSNVSNHMILAENLNVNNLGQQLEKFNSSSINKQLTYEKYINISKDYYIFSGNYRQFSKKLRSTAPKTAFDNLSYHDLRRLVNKKEKSSTAIRKFCKILYDRIPKEGSNLHNIALRKRPFSKCLQSPQNYLQISSMKFLKDVAKEGKIKLIKDPVYGKINQGNAYFALYGARSSVNTGSRTSDAFSYGIGGGVWAHATALPTFLDASIKYSHTNETYEQQNYADMYASFDREYISYQTLDLKYENIYLQFSVKEKICLSVSDYKNTKHILICDDQYRKNSIVESWHFVGRINDGKTGIFSGSGSISQGLAVYNQIIRGEANFKKFQKILSNKTAVVAAENISDIDPSNVLYKFLKEKKAIFINNQMPGIIKN